MEKYFTKDQFLEERGINLETELKNDDNKSTKVDRFIKKVTDWCLRYLIKNYPTSGGDLMNWDKVSEDRQKYFIEGCMEQAEYILNNGFAGLNSGYDFDKGIIVDFSKIKMSKDALDIFFMGRFANIACIARNQRPWEY